jgi:hypothetical protein
LPSSTLRSQKKRSTFTSRRRAVLSPALFYAAYVLGRLGDFVVASRLAALLSEVEETDDDWDATVADHVLMKLRS